MSIGEGEKEGGDGGAAGDGGGGCLRFEASTICGKEKESRDAVSVGRINRFSTSVLTRVYQLDRKKRKRIARRRSESDNSLFFKIKIKKSVLPDGGRESSLILTLLVVEEEEEEENDNRYLIELCSLSVCDQVVVGD